MSYPPEGIPAIPRWRHHPGKDPQVQLRDLQAFIDGCINRFAKLPGLPYVGDGSAYRVGDIAIISDINDLYHADWGELDMLRVAPSTSWTITGFLPPPVSGKHVVYVRNIGPGYLILAHESALSLVASRICCPEGVALTVWPRGTITLVRDTISERWCVACCEGAPPE